MKRAAFWILLALVSLAATAAAYHYFPQAFSIVALDITMTRERALTDAAAIAARDRLGPSDYRQAASFALDSEAQTFVELEGGGKAAFTNMLRERLYSAYTWRVRHFREGETNETLIRFTPDGRPYGFVEKLDENAPGAAIEAADARRRAEADAQARWNVDLAPFTSRGAGTGATARRTRRSHADLRAIVAGPRRGPVSPPAGAVRRPADRSHALRADSRGVHPPLRAACGRPTSAIGIGSVVGMVLLYVVGGIGVGLFFMLRARYVLWRQAAVWGLIVGAHAGTGDAQRVAADVDDLRHRGASLDVCRRTGGDARRDARRFLGVHGAVVHGGRNAWPAGVRPPSAILARLVEGPWELDEILGRTVAGYLLVAVFFAYDVGLYLVATRLFGWWTPSEALLHPDVLATYVPWLSAIANSLQAGFWEECLFRAVPLAGAALIGDRFGKRGLFLAIAFVVQAAIFGAGHAPYPTQPSYARPVELILPSIGFGLLYVYFGLLARDRAALRIRRRLVRAADFPVGGAGHLGPATDGRRDDVRPAGDRPVAATAIRRVDRAVAGATATKPGHHLRAPEPEPAAPAIVQSGLSPGCGARGWRSARCSIVACIWGALGRERIDMFVLSRTAAADIARSALAARGVTLGPQWRVLPVPDDGSGGPHEFVSETAGEERRRQLLGRYLPEPRWNVRIATFEGDVAERAEEWRVFVTKAGQILRTEHTLPEARPGATLDENAARERAVAIVARDFGLDIAGGTLREVSARPAKRKARTDWTFTFVDASLPPLPQGEPRIAVEHCRRRGDRRAPVRLRSRAMGTSAARDRDPQPDRSDHRRRRLWRVARLGGRRRSGGLEPPALHAKAVPCRDRNHVCRDARRGGQ